MEISPHDDAQWPYVRTLLPTDLDDSARRCAALVRRRGVRDAEALVRVLLAYGCTDLSLQSVATWAEAMKLSTLSAPALFYRVRDAERWLSELLATLIASDVRPAQRKMRMRVVDASVLTGPGTTGTDWRLHVQADPASGKFCAVEITDKHGGEKYGRHHFEQGDVVLGDRGYGHAHGIDAVAASGAHVVVRINPHAIRFCDENRKVIDIRRRARQVPQTGVVEWTILLPIPPARRTKSKNPWKLSKASGWREVRVVAARNREGHIVWILTTLRPESASAVEIADLYRIRWQIELLFKRLKSLLKLDALPTRKGPTARSWILARLLAAALAQKLLDPNEALSPWGYALR